jgi:hypothetical protein
MKKERIPLKGGDEFDAFTMRKWYIYLTRSGVAKSIKKKYNKRFRRNGKDKVKSSCEEL